MIVVTTDQRTPAWYAARVGRLTGSRACDVLAKIKTGEAAARRDLRLQLACERLTGQPDEDGYINAAMQRGIDKEGDAFAAYEAATGLLAQTVGFLAHDTLPAGCSPDGEVGGFEGLLELKCPKSSTHLRYLRSRAVPTDYLAQITHNLWITGASWCDFVSFDDRLPPALRLFVTRVTRASVDVTAYEQTAVAFLAEVDRDVAEILALVAETEAA